jgi:hypothetical protein
VDTGQKNTYGSAEGSRLVDVPPNQDPRGAENAGQPQMRSYHSLNYHPAIDAQGNADCEQGQNGFIKGPLHTGSRYARGALPDGTPSGGNWTVNDNRLPGLQGGTYKSRQLGIRNLKDVP